MTPTARSLKHLREQGYTCQVVERWNSFTKTRHDLWGIGDILCLRGAETLLVQTTSGDNVSKRVAKIADCEHLPAIREAGWRIICHGWRKGANGRYTLREVDCS